MGADQYSLKCLQMPMGSFLKDLLGESRPQEVEPRFTIYAIWETEAKQPMFEFQLEPELRNGDACRRQPARCERRGCCSPKTLQQTLFKQVCGGLFGVLNRHLLNHFGHKAHGSVLMGCSRASTPWQFVCPNYI